MDFSQKRRLSTLKRIFLTFALNYSYTLFILFIPKLHCNGFPKAKMTLNETNALQSWIKKWAVLIYFKHLSGFYFLVVILNFFREINK